VHWVQLLAAEPPLEPFEPHLLQTFGIPLNGNLVVPNGFHLTNLVLWSTASNHALPIFYPNIL